ncbi:unnamed protein product [Owenia fusiformis]|uniref:Uncharacterized protein n=1 Tax=Owenia fusiformis TaxID=6347 RepID=A0A8J1XMH4_OWEFU|nr:unnamed protein product [Owenia fusiformis]
MHTAQLLSKTAMVKQLLLLSLTSLLVLACTAQDRNHKGRQFVVAFIPAASRERRGYIGLAISAEETTEVEIFDRITGNTDLLTVPGGSTQLHDLPLDLRTREDFEQKGISVTATNPVSVVGINQYLGTDTFLALPVESLDTNYIAATYRPSGIGSYACVTVVASQDFTSVRILRHRAGRAGYDAEPTVVGLNRLQTYTLVYWLDDITGTLVSASSPVAVFTGNTYARDFGHIEEQMPPISALGTEFMLTPVMSEGYNRDFVRVIAAYNDTEVEFHSVDFGYFETIDQGRNYDVNGRSERLPENIFHNVTCSRPCLVIQCKGWDSNQSWMTVVPPINQFSSGTHVFPAFNRDRFPDYQSYVQVLIQSGRETGMTLDGAEIAEWVDVPNSTYRAARIRVDPASHTLEHPDPNQRFYSNVYGVPFLDFGYGNPVGISVNRINSMEMEFPPQMN